MDSVQVACDERLREYREDLNLNKYIIAINSIINDFKKSVTDGGIQSLILLRTIALKAYLIYLPATEVELESFTKRISDLQSLKDEIEDALQIESLSVTTRNSLEGRLQEVEDTLNGLL